MRSTSVESASARHAPRLRGVVLLSAALLTTGLATDAANAESISDALASAYQTNPALDAERARLRATEEEIARARSGFLPRVGLSGSYGYETSETLAGTSKKKGDLNPSGYGINARQSIFSGFQTTNALYEAEATVRAGQEKLRNAEGQTLLNAAAAYASVVRDREILAKRKANVSVLSRTLNETHTRMKSHEVTATDYEQVRARLARADASAKSAIARLRASEAAYLRVVGHAPEKLATPNQTAPGLPASLDAALAIATSEHALVRGAHFKEEASQYVVEKYRGELLPDVAVEAQYNKDYDSSLFTNRQDDARVVGRLNIPLFEGGEVRARIRQAKELQISNAHEIADAKAEITARVATAWSQLEATRGEVAANKTQLSAARRALEGVREEERISQRSVLDVLNAEQELIEAEVSLASTQADLVIASYGVLEAIGRLGTQFEQIEVDVGDVVSSADTSPAVRAQDVAAVADEGRGGTGAQAEAHPGAAMRAAGASAAMPPIFVDNGDDQQSMPPVIVVNAAPSPIASAVVSSGPPIIMDSVAPPAVKRGAARGVTIKPSANKRSAAPRTQMAATKAAAKAKIAARAVVVPASQADRTVAPPVAAVGVEKNTVNVNSTMPLPMNAPLVSTVAASPRTPTREEIFSISAQEAHDASLTLLRDPAALAQP